MTQWIFNYLNLSKVNSMHLSDYERFISSLAVITTILQFLSGVLVCKQYVKAKTTGDSSVLPFISGFLSCSLWLQYGIHKQDDKIIFVNTIGVLLFVAYTIVFYIFTFKKSAVIKQVSMVIILLILVIIYEVYELDHDLLIRRLGLMACIVSLCFIGAPLTKLYYVLRVKSTACLPFPMIIMAFLVSMLWFLYGVIINDPFLQMPNFIGAMLSGFQLCLFLIYANDDPTTLPGKKATTIA